LGDSRIPQIVLGPSAQLTGLNIGLGLTPSKRDSTSNYIFQVGP
jgi:hypothetical protein